MWKKSLFFLAFVLNSKMSFAEKMDLNTHTVVIDRLRSVIESLDENDVSKVPSTLRLADLLAERSRLKSLSEVEKNCTNCLKSKEDREEAIRYYAAILPRLKDDVRGQALLQKAHLHVNLLQSQLAEKIYSQIIKEGSKRHSGLILGQSYASLGDIQFQKGLFSKAKFLYEKSLDNPETPQKGMVHYRLAWCLFNMEQVSKAIAKMEMILKTPKLTEYVGQNGITQDESFKIDVAKDLSAFYARTTINQETLNKIIALSPESQKIENIHYLAQEADRLGKKKESALAWMFYLNHSKQNKDALTAQIQIMKLKRDTGDFNGAIQLFTQIQDVWKNQGCGETCDSLQTEIRNWIIHWNREEKKTQTPQIITAYSIYSDLFPKDEEMLLLGANAAQERKQYKIAYDFFRQAATVSHYNLQNSAKKDDNKQKRIEILNNSLIGEMDMAETLKEANLRMSSYQHYLTINENGEKVFDVRFQIAKLYFETKNYEKAAQDFHTLAMDTKNKERAKEKLEAAHLAINSLIQIKDDSTIELFSLEFAKQFPNEKNAFYKIHRKSVLNTVASKINEKKATNSDLVKLKSVSLLDSTPQEQRSLYKNMYLLSLQLKNFKEALHANLNFLAIKNLTQQEKNQAINDRIWLAEMELDYKEAYALTLNLPGAPSEERLLKLIWLAEMAQINPEKHEVDFLKISHKRNLRASIIVRRIQRQMLPQKMLKQHIQELAQSPDILAKLALEIYSKTSNRQILEDVFSYSTVRKCTFAALISHLISYPLIQKDIQKIAALKIRSQNQSSLKKSLEERLQALSHFETSLKESIRTQDLQLQALFLNVLKYEYSRLHKDLLSLPIPRGLNKEQTEQYKNLLAQQAEPYLLKSQKIDEKLQLLWGQEEWVLRLANNYKVARPEYRPALKEELYQLSKNAPPSKARYLQQIMNEKISFPSQQMVAQAKNKVRSQPFEESAVSQLKDLEQQRGNDFTVSYLEARLTQMKGLFR